MKLKFLLKHHFQSMTSVVISSGQLKLNMGT